MPLTNAEYQRRYREKLKNNNLEEYKEKKRLEFKKHYNKNKLSIIQPKEDVNIVELKPFDKHIKLNKSVLCDNTKTQYLNAIKNLYSEYNNGNLLPPDIENEIILNLDNKPHNYKTISNALQFIKPNILKIVKDHYSNINIIYAVITRIKFFSNIVKMLYPYINEKIIKYNQQQDNKIIDDNIKKQLNSLSFDKNDILNNMIKLDNDIDKLIYGLLTLTPTRRINDYRIMFISTSLPNIKDKNDMNNYYFNKKFYFLNTKNKQKQILDIPDELDSLIKDKNTDKSYLFGKLFNQSTLSKKVMNIFHNIYGFKLSPVEIRRLYATTLNNIDDVERSKISYLMNHSLTENKRYAYKPSTNPS